MIDLPSPVLIGVIHLPPLPGSASHMLSMEEIAERAVADAGTLAKAGFDGAIIENFGDRPFAAEHVHSATVACMAVIGDRVRQQTSLRLGINVLRNDAQAALGVAVAVGARFVRVNLHTGVAATDQGMLQGKAHETLVYRRQLGARIAVLADVHVKHAVPVSEPDIARAARDTAYRGLADGLIVTGDATGSPVKIDDLRRVREAVPDRRLFVGSGATAGTLPQLLQYANGIIVGTALKPGGDIDQPIDLEIAASFSKAIRRGPSS